MPADSNNDFSHGCYISLVYSFPLMWGVGITSSVFVVGTIIKGKVRGYAYKEVS